MSKKAKTMGILGGLLLILVIAYASLFIYNARQQSGEEESEEGILIGELDAADITGFAFQVNAEDFENDVYTFHKSGDSWMYKDDSKFPVNQNVAEAKVTVLSAVYAKRLLEENPSDLSKYGLDEPVLTVSATDGRQTITYLVGDYNANTETYYIKIKDDPNVYTADGSLWVAFSMNLYDMAKVEEVPEIQLDHITHVNIQNGTDELDFTFNREGTEEEASTGKVTITGTWYIKDESGAIVPANSSKTQLLMNLLIELEYLSEINYNSSESELESYGLLSPSATVTIDYTVDEVDLKTVEQVEVDENVNEIAYETNSVEKQYVLKIGGSSSSYTYNDDYFATAGGSSAVMTVDASTVEMLKGLRAEDYISATQ